MYLSFWFIKSDKLLNCSGQPISWYVVFRGRQPGVYADWAICQAQVLGYSHSSYKKFKTQEEAVRAYQVFVHFNNGRINEDMTPKEAPIVPDNKLYPCKDVIMHLALFGFAVMLFMYWKKVTTIVLLVPDLM